MDMSEAEILENYWASQEAGLAALTLSVTVFSGYILACYLIGAKLTKSQAGFISTAFTVISIVFLWAVAVYFSEGHSAAQLLKESHPSIVMLNANPTGVFVFTGIAAIIGALKFMWDIRHPKTE
jgi:hypothetical protein